MEFIRPMLAVNGQPFSRKDWIFEPKFDGIRCIAHRRNGRTYLQNRRMADITAKYPEIVERLRVAAPADCALDGELVIFRGGKPLISALQSRELQDDRFKIGLLARSLPASFILFDILRLEERRLEGTPLAERKEILSGTIVQGSGVYITDYIPGEGEAYYQASIALGFEGVVGKRADSPYRPGVRSPDWVKCKKILTIDLVVGGFTHGSGARGSTFGALLLGGYDPDGRLVHVTKVGSGFSEEAQSTIMANLEKRLDSPFADSPPGTGITWVNPTLAVEVQAQEITPAGSLRAPRFARIRPDKDPLECLLPEMG
ncbi:MAG: non-homologous end-joining DNA ligase [Methanolinea sp.]|nr:non-homologous end-joining DNA ligase [Methanolinea sp.]